MKGVIKMTMQQHIDAHRRAKQKYYDAYKEFVTSYKQLHLCEYLTKYKKGTVDNMDTQKIILHTTSTFIKDGVYIKDAQDIISLIDYFNLTKEKYHFDILTIDGYFDCLELFLQYIGTEYEETIDSMLSEYQRYLLNDFQKMKAKTHLSSVYGISVKGGENNE